MVGMAFSGGDATSSGLDSLSEDWISKWVKMDNSFLFFLFIYLFLSMVWWLLNHGIRLLCRLVIGFLTD